MGQETQRLEIIETYWNVNYITVEIENNSNKK